MSTAPQHDADDSYWPELAVVAIRWIGGGAAVVLVVLIIALGIRHNIDSNQQVKLQCIDHGGSWIAGHCIQPQQGMP